MTVQVFSDVMKTLLIDPVAFVEERVLSILNRDREAWGALVSSAANKELFIPKTTVPHMHPNDQRVPCMVCAAHSRDLTTVSAVVLLSLSEIRYKDDYWNSDNIRRPDHIVTACKSVVADKDAMKSMFGPNWGILLSLAYRIEFANPVELVELLQKAVSTPGSSTVARLDGGRDWSQPARWLISNAMSGRRSAVKSPTKTRHNADSGRMIGLASVLAVNGTDDEALEEWVVNDPRDPSSKIEFRPLQSVN